MKMPIYTLSFLLLAQAPGAAQGQKAPVTPTFNGTGPNDATFTRSAEADRFVVTISATGTPDQFTWSRNGSPPSLPVAISGAEQPLAGTVTVTFRRTTGHTLGALWTLEATPGHAPFLQRGPNAVPRDVHDKLRDAVSVLDFGARCDGITDDRAAIQAAVDAVAGSVLHVPGPCVVSAPGLILYPANAGITLLGMTTARYGGAYSPGMGGFVALAASPPARLLTVYAQNAKLENLYLDGNHKAAVNGLVSAMGLGSTWRNVTVRQFSADGGQANLYATPVVKILAGGSAGSTEVTVESAVNDRLRFGEYYCTQAMFDYGSPATQEQLAIGGVSGNVLRLSRALLRGHSTVQCAGNSNDMHITHYSSQGNGGWGWRVVPGSDVNAIYWDNGASSGNALGGELWCGSVHTHLAGNYEGDGGPAIQLGDLDGGTYGDSCVTHYMKIDPIGDLEENRPEFNTVSAVCDDSSQVQFNTPAALTIQRGPAACPPYSAGTTTTGIGTDNNQRFVVKNAFGAIGVEPGPAGVRFYDSAGILLSTFAADETGGFAARQRVTDFAHAQLEADGGVVGSGSCNGCRLMLGYRTDTKEGFVQATARPEASPMTLNPLGGAVKLGVTTTVSQLPASCSEGDRRFVTNAKSAGFNDPAVDAAREGNHVPVFCDGSHVWRIG